MMLRFALHRLFGGCSALPHPVQANRWISACRSVTSSSSAVGDPSLPPAFVFDIDGVLVRGKQVLPAALEAMRMLVGGDGRWRYPVCFLTNGGGTLEAVKAKQLSDWLQVPVDPSQVVLSHTPMKDLVPRLGARPVLVSGLGDVMAAARSYGFSNILHTSQLGAAAPAATPFSRYPPGQELVEGGACPVRDLGWATERQPIEAVLVMYDPDDWQRDLQLLLDVVLYGGAPLGDAPKVGDVPPERQVEVIFSNPDLLWANSHPHPRLGQGAFAAALQALHTRITGRDLPRVQSFGKPNPEPYRLIEKQLIAQGIQLGLLPATSGNVPNMLTASEQPPTLPFSSIFAVGDNPAADVRGANKAGSPWVSVLVRTGVFRSTQPNSDTDPAHVVVDDVLGAVKAAFHRCRELRWHQYR